MKYYHATDKKNLRGIQRVGLLARLASGKLPAVWVVAKANIDGGIRHCCLRRGVKAKDVVILELEIPRKDVRRFSMLGYLYTKKDVPPSCIRVYGRVTITMGGE